MVEQATSHGGAIENDTAHWWPGPPLPWTLCFIRRADQLLLLERRREPNRGLWSDVGGKLETSESPWEAVLREVREETGLDLTDCSDVRFCGVVTWNHDDRPSTGAYAFVAVVPEDFVYPTPRETDEGVLDWKALEWVLDAANEHIPASARRYLRTLLEDTGHYEHRFLLSAGQITGYLAVPR